MFLWVCTSFHEFPEPKKYAALSEFESLIRAPSITLPRLRNYTRVDDVVERVHAIALARHVHLVGMVDHDAAVAVAAAAVDRRPAVLLPAAGGDLAAEGLRGGGALGGSGLPGSGAFVVEGAGIGGWALAWEEGGEGGIEGWEEQDEEGGLEDDGRHCDAVSWEALMTGLKGF